MKDKIIEFEQQMLDLRKQLNELLADKNVQSDEALKDKVHFFKTELMHLNRQYELLAKQVDKSASQMVQQPAQQPAPQPVQQVAQQPVPQPVIRPQAAPVAKKTEKSIENTVGASIMGILASGLIFISIILFATLALPYMSNPVKMLICYIISFVLIGISLFWLRKKPDNKFFLSLAACGMGALYISFLLTNIYFDYIGDLVLFVLIALWVGAMAYLSKAKSQLFAIIGHLGILVAVIFGVILCSIQEAYGKFIMLTIFFVIAYLTLYITHFNRKINKNIATNIFATINLLVLFIGSSAVTENGEYSPYYLLFFAIIIAFMALIMLGDWSESFISYGVFLTGYAFIFILGIIRYMDGAEPAGLCIYALSMIVLLLVEFKKKRDMGGQIFAQIFMLNFAFIAMIVCHDIIQYIYVPLFVLPLLVIGVFRKNVILKYTALASAFLYLIWDIELLEHFTVAFVVLVVMYALCYLKKEGTAYKVLMHLFSVCFIIAMGDKITNELAIDDEMASIIVYIVLAAFNFGMLALARYKKENDVVYNVVNVFLMIVGLDMFTYMDAVYNVLLIPTVLAVFCVNSKNILDKHKMFSGMYVGFKFTLLLMFIMGSFDTINYVVSIVLIIMAIACIILGFIKKYKALRVYGLVLVMISIFKLIMVDIQYENTLGNALSFFVSGILCFVISLIYNYIGRKLDVNQSSST
ncbi:MAG: DUF2339 domain-containing protein [Lachnospira sp.]|nr:DUF2339 domain-containing protein [Lachnospira sp.]